MVIESALRKLKGQIDAVGMRVDDGGPGGHGLDDFSRELAQLHSKIDVIEGSVARLKTINETKEIKFGSLGFRAQLITLVGNGLCSSLQLGCRSRVRIPAKGSSNILGRSCSIQPQV